MRRGSGRCNSATTDSTWAVPAPARPQPAAGEVVGNGLEMKFTDAPPGEFVQGTPLGERNKLTREREAPLQSGMERRPSI